MVDLGFDFDFDFAVPRAELERDRRECGGWRDDRGGDCRGGVFGVLGGGAGGGGDRMAVGSLWAVVRWNWGVLRSFGLEVVVVGRSVMVTGGSTMEGVRSFVELGRLR